MKRSTHRLDYIVQVHVRVLTVILRLNTYKFVVIVKKPKIILGKILRNLRIQAWVLFCGA